MSIVFMGLVLGFDFCLFLCCYDFGGDEEGGSGVQRGLSLLSPLHGSQVPDLFFNPVVVARICKMRDHILPKPTFSKVIYFVHAK